MSPSDALEAPASFTTPLGSFDTYNIKHRVVAPPHERPLQTLPAGDCAAGELIQRTFGSELQSKALQIAAENGVHVRADVVNYVRKSYDGDSIAILMVADDWKAKSSPAVWQKIVEQVKCYVDGRVKETPNIGTNNLTVEMIHSDLLRQKYMEYDHDECPHEARNVYKCWVCGAVNAMLVQAWRLINNRVSEILQDFDATKGHFHTFDMIRLGFDPIRENNPRTLSVLMDSESDETGWPPVIAKVEEFLDSLGLGLRFHMELCTGWWDECGFD